MNRKNLHVKISNLSGEISFWKAFSDTQQPCLRKRSKVQTQNHANTNASARLRCQFKVYDITKKFQFKQNFIGAPCTSILSVFIFFKQRVNSWNTRGIRGIRGIQSTQGSPSFSNTLSSLKQFMWNGLNVVWNFVLLIQYYMKKLYMMLYY